MDNEELDSLEELRRDLAWPTGDWLGVPKKSAECIAKRLIKLGYRKYPEETPEQKMLQCDEEY
jgi:hypothetical protein